MAAARGTVCAILSVAGAIWLGTSGCDAAALEALFAGDPNDPNDPNASGPLSAQMDSDGDGLSDAREQRLGSDPLAVDSDEDGIEDGREIELGLDPTKLDLVEIVADFVCDTLMQTSRRSSDPVYRGLGTDAPFRGFSVGDRIVFDESRSSVVHLPSGNVDKAELLGQFDTRSRVNRRQAFLRTVLLDDGTFWLIDAEDQTELGAWREDADEVFVIEDAADQGRFSLVNLRRCTLIKGEPQN